MPLSGMDFFVMQTKKMLLPQNSFHYGRSRAITMLEHHKYVLSNTR
ncbi:hypothetical protein SAMN05216378_3170 [Paenibacillus catalpae]|uniref:Uncharacterized protein n=1 Tax=Paenibacillus catalpae TaxID=1045775 RepID=A0A1I2ANN2_9BACL|nr:hypothetical protein SAMN05216378_3170 [Paenibacillus catalpae]